MSEPSSVLVKEYIVTPFRTRPSSRNIERTAFSESAMLAYSSFRLSGPSIARNSIAGSFHSSVNSMRSSMSWGRTITQMLEMRDRLRRPDSGHSSWGQKARSSIAVSIDSHGRTFEQVTGMPANGPDIDVSEKNILEHMETGDSVMIDRIDEETDELSLINDPSLGIGLAV
jgi:hypothetical protein